MSRKHIIPVIFFMLLAGTANAGKGRNRNKPDTLQPYRLFSAVAKDWQQPPLQLRVSVSNTSNFISSAGDTATQEGAFYLKGKGAYVSFGEMEQVLDDSTALMINHSQHRMVFFNGAGRLAEAMRNMLVAPVTGLDSLAKRYRALEAVAEDGSPAVTLVGRALVPGTDISLEQIEMRYHKATHLPVVVTSVRRTAVPLNQQQYRQVYDTKPELHASLVDAGNGHYWLVKEKQTVFQFRSISHDPGTALPVTMADRVSRKSDGSFRPVKNYQEYELTDDTF